MQRLSFTKHTYLGQLTLYDERKQSEDEDNNGENSSDMGNRERWVASS